ncbi:3-oxoacid CoA-transferase [Microbacterium sp. USTB-Y]|uniref:3-oxoacid CoA-transferase n=1 Tax=Microbacterium sp. USTB-Y TaxID=2823692 RepID=UPI00203B9E69|nr:3-oxoacid CoA-transferase subunit A [Microbacterium sp. USTB-Y]
MPNDKIFPSPEAAVADVPDGATIAVAGFGLTQSFPSSLTVALRAQGAKELCIVANSLGEGPYRSMTLIENHQVKRLIVSFSARASGDRSPAEQQIAAGDIEVELVPQGTLVERLRAAGAGIGAVFTRTGVGTVVAEGKEVRTIDGVDYVLEKALPVDYALIRARRADRFGNLDFAGVGRNFMPSFAKGAQIAIAEVDEIVEGALPPESIDLPGIFVDRVVLQTADVKPRFWAARPGAGSDAAQEYNGKRGWTRGEMAKITADLIPEGSYVNLGVGMPTLVSNHIAGRDVTLHGENGVLGYGEAAAEEDYDPALYNAGGEYVRLRPGGSYFESVTAFEMVRGGHVDAVVLGGFQVDAHANLANWSQPAMVGGGIGGAMDLVAGGGTVMVMMTHTAKNGAHKLVAECDYPLTGPACVDIVVTDLAVFRWNGERFVVERVADGFSFDEIAELTDFPLVASPEFTAREGAFARD